MARTQPAYTPTTTDTSKPIPQEYPTEKITATTHFKWDKTIRYTDTTIAYEIQGISDEGCGMTVSYKLGQISTIKLEIYTCSGQTKLTLNFQNNNEIQVQEHRFKYKQGLAEAAKNPNTIQPTQTLNYNIDKDGKTSSDTQLFYNSIKKYLIPNLNTSH
jgi:hypothetical protein